MLGSPLHLSDCVNLSFIKVCTSMMYEVFKRTTAGEVWKYDRMKITKYEGLKGRWFWSKYGVWRNSQQQLPHDARERCLCHESLSGRFRAGSSKPGKTTTTCSSSPSWSRSSPTEYKEIMPGQIISYHQNLGHFDEDEHLVACGDVHNRVKT